MAKTTRTTPQSKEIPDASIMPEAAAETVDRVTEAVLEQAETTRTKAKQFNDKAEKTAVSLIGQFAALSHDLLDITQANIEHALATVQKCAAAKSIPDAISIQADFVHDSAHANFDRMRIVAEKAGTSVTKAAESAREEAARLLAAGNKAA